MKITEILPLTNCPDCEGTGYVYYIDANDYEYSRVCDCIMKQRAEFKRKARSGMTTSQFDTFETKEEWQHMIKNASMQFASHGKGWFFIGGQRGCGKTHLCKAICDKLMEHKTVGYMNYVSEVRRLKYDGEERDIDNWKNIEVLYIDDLFKVAPTDAELKIVFEILNHRYENGKTTIISSEHTFNELMEIDEAIASRIKEKSGSYMLNIAPNESRNYRLKK